MALACLLLLLIGCISQVAHTNALNCSLKYDQLLTQSKDERFANLEQKVDILANFTHYQNVMLEHMRILTKEIQTMKTTTSLATSAPLNNCLLYTSPSPRDS